MNASGECFSNSCLCGNASTARSASLLAFSSSAARRRTQSESSSRTGGGSGKHLGAWKRAQYLDSRVEVEAFKDKNKKTGARLFGWRCRCPVGRRTATVENEEICCKTCSETDDPAARFRQHVIQMHDHREHWKYDNDRKKCTPAMYLYPNATPRFREKTKERTSYTRVKRDRVEIARLLFAQGFDPTSPADLSWLQETFRDGSSHGVRADDADGTTEGTVTDTGSGSMNVEDNVQPGRATRQTTSRGVTETGAGGRGTGTVAEVQGRRASRSSAR